MFNVSRCFTLSPSSFIHDPLMNVNEYFVRRENFSSIGKSEKMLNDHQEELMIQTNPVRVCLYPLDFALSKPNFIRLIIN